MAKLFQDCHALRQDSPLVQHLDFRSCNAGISWQANKRPKQHKRNQKIRKSFNKWLTKWTTKWKRYASLRGSVNPEVNQEVVVKKAELLSFRLNTTNMFTFAVDEPLSWVQQYFSTRRPATLRRTPTANCSQPIFRRLLSRRDPNPTHHAPRAVSHPALASLGRRHL